jgi:hypothetical protein
MILDVVHLDVGLLEDLAAHGIFEALTRFHETGDSGIPAFRPASLATEQALLAPADQDDNCRINPREDRLAACLVGALPAVASRFRTRR